MRTAEVVRPRVRDHASLVVIGASALALALAGWLGISLFKTRVRELDRITPPIVRPIPAASVFIDNTPVHLTVTAGTEKIPFTTTADAVRSDVTLWRRMEISDWNVVPLPLRTEGIDAMLERFRALVLDPGTWDRLEATDWDVVPQPIRALAFRHMAEYWTGYYQVGAEFGIPRGLAAATLEAIAMSESWFDHRAVNESVPGNRDLGVAQSSDRARQRLRDLYAAGRVDAAFDDEEYFNPWVGTRFLALWFNLVLHEAGGDLDVAIRVYHRGSGNAFDKLGDVYLDGVLRRRHRYIRNHGASATWDYLWRRDRELRAAAWPWLAGDRN